MLLPFLVTQEFGWQSESILSTVQSLPGQDWVASKSMVGIRLTAFAQFVKQKQQTCFRKWKYDESVPEYFVQTSDVVRVKKSELEKYMQQSNDPDEA